MLAKEPALSYTYDGKGNVFPANAIICKNSNYKLWSDRDEVLTIFFHNPITSIFTNKHRYRSISNGYRLYY